MYIPKILTFFFFFELLFFTPIFAQNQEQTNTTDHYQQYLDLSYSKIDSLMYIQYNKGAFDKAIPLMKAGRDKANNEFGSQDSVFASYTSNLGIFYTQTGQYDKALSLYIQALNIQEKIFGKAHPDFATTLNNLAVLHQSMGDFGKALPLYIQALNIQEKIIGKEHSDFALLLNNLAALYSDMENYNKALPLLNQALNITEKVFGKEHSDFTSTLNNLALLHQRMGNLDKALLLFTQSIKIEKKVLGKEHPDFATSLGNMAQLHQNMMNYDKALPFLIQTLNIQEKVFGKEHPTFISSLNNLAQLYEKMNKFNFAWKTVTQAYNNYSVIDVVPSFDKAWADSLIAIPSPSSRHLNNMITSLETTCRLLQKDSTITDANSKIIIVTDLALTLLTKLRNQTSNENDKLRLLAQSNLWLQKKLNILNPTKHASMAFSLADQNKSVLLLQATKAETAYRLGNLPDSLVRRDKKLLKKQSQLQAKLVERRPKQEKDSLRNQLNHLNRDIDAFLQVIKRQYTKYHELKYQQVDAKLENIQALLKDNTALIEYVIGDSVLHIFLVTKTQVEWAKSLVNKKELKQHIRILHNALSDYKTAFQDKKTAYRQYTAQAHWFYLNLIAPVLKNKENIQNLILVTDGKLGHLPFETFLVEQAPQNVTSYHQLHYLVKDYNISYNYSATLWKENIEIPTPKNNGQILAMAANYHLQLDSSMIDVRLPTDQWLREVLDPLPAARKEVETLQEKYQGFFAFDNMASEKIVKEKAADFAILHFATHGILNTKRPVLSSLAFSEDNDSIESNFWQAHEISKIQLNADLVVLSACETGFGKFEKGNGIASLARAFMYAGASSLIVSLWQVNDYATSEIMKNLYANLSNGMKKDAALRHAKIQYMESSKGFFAHPTFWSPFIMMGNTQPISIKKKNVAMPWMIGGGLFLLALGAVAIRRRKK